MKVFIPNIHGDHDYYMIKTLSKAGYDIYYPSVDFHEKGRWKYVIRDDFSHVSDNYSKIDLEEFKNTDFDILFIQCIEHEADMRSLYEEFHPDTPVVYVSGNNYQVWQFKGPVEHHICFDIQNYKYQGAKHKVYILPFLEAGDYFKHRPFTEKNFEDKKISSYTWYYPEWDSSYRRVLRLKNNMENLGYDFNIYATQYPEPKKRFDEPFQLKEHNVPKEDILIERVAEDLAVSHIKPFEGYGFHIWKSLMIGRPVIGYFDMLNKTCGSFLLDGITAFICEEGKELEFYKYLNDILSDKNAMLDISEQCAKHIRNLTCPENNEYKLFRFLNEI